MFSYHGYFGGHFAKREGREDQAASCPSFYMPTMFGSHLPRPDHTYRPFFFLFFRTEPFWVVAKVTLAGWACLDRCQPCDWLYYVVLVCGNLP